MNKQEIIENIKRYLIDYLLLHEIVKYSKNAKYFISMIPKSTIEIHIISENNKDGSVVKEVVEQLSDLIPHRKGLDLFNAKIIKNDLMFKSFSRKAIDYIKEYFLTYSHFQNINPLSLSIEIRQVDNGLIVYGIDKSNNKEREIPLHELFRQ